MRTTRKVLSSLAVVALGLFFVAGPASAVGTATATPNSNLSDGQTVMLELSGIDFNKASVDAEQCPRTAVVQSDCFVSETAVPIPVQDGTTQPGGEPFVVKALPQCMPDLCAIFIVEDTTTFDGGAPARANITFAPTATTSTTATTVPSTTTTTIPPVVPEVPKSPLLLPLGAALALGFGTVVMIRRRGVPVSN